MKPPVIHTRKAARAFGASLALIPDLPFHAYPWTVDYALTMHDLGQLNKSIADDWEHRWDAEQRAAVNAVYFSILIEGKS